MPAGDLANTAPTLSPPIDDADIKVIADSVKDGAGRPLSNSSPNPSPSDVAAVVEAVAEAVPAAASAGETLVAAPVRHRSRGTLPVVGLFALALIGALYLGRAILMPILFGMIMALVLAPVVERLSRLRIPEPIGAALVMLGVLGLLVLAVELLVLPAREMLAELPVQIQTLLTNALEWMRSFRLGNWLKPPSSADLSKQATAQSISMTGEVLKIAQSFIISVVSAGILAYFLLSSGDLFLTKLVRVLPTIRDKVRAVKVVRTVQQEVATYFASVGMINLGLGFAVTLLTWAFGLPMPWFWGAMVALLNFVPYIGATVSALTLLLAGMAFTESTSKAFLLLTCFVGITFVEGQLINPVLVGKRLELNHTLVFVALLFWGWLWGVGGMLLAVPLLIIIKKFADHTPGWEAVAEFLARR